MWDKVAGVQLFKYLFDLSKDMVNFLQGFWASTYFIWALYVTILSLKS